MVLHSTQAGHGHCLFEGHPWRGTAHGKLSAGLWALHLTPDGPHSGSGCSGTLVPKAAGGWHGQGHPVAAARPATSWALQLPWGPQRGGTRPYTLPQSMGDTGGTRCCLVLSICAPKHPSPRQDPPSCAAAGSRQTAGQAGSPAGGSRAWNTCHLATETHRMVMTPSAKNLQAFDTLFNLMLLSLILNCIYRH